MTLFVGYEPHADPSQGRDHVYWAPIESIGEVDEPIAVLTPHLPVQRVHASSAIALLQTTARQLYAVRPDGEVSRVDPPGWGIPQSEAVIGDHIIWEDWSDLVRLVHRRLGEPASLLRRVDPGDIKRFRTDGEELAWLEGYDRQPDRRYQRLELWAAAYRPDIEAMEPRRVRSLEVNSIPAYGQGWYVMRREEPRHYEIVSTATGELRRWVAPGGATAAGPEPVYVSREEILFGGLAPNQLIRLDPRSVPVVEEPPED